MFKLKNGIPKSFKINGNTWLVKIVNLEELFEEKSDTLGVTVFDPIENIRQILLDESLKTNAQRARVFCHELMHAIIYESKLPPGSICETAEEVLCEQFADFLNQELS